MGLGKAGFKPYGLFEFLYGLICSPPLSIGGPKVIMGLGKVRI
jgi:hypothetical protein